MELAVPPLRRRKEDLLPLARILLAEAALKMKRPVEGLSPQAADHLLAYGWPGNVRELANVMERAVAVAQRNRIDVEDLPPEVRAAPIPAPAGGARRHLSEIEKDYIIETMQSNGGNRREAALELGIGLATLHRKLRAYRASEPQARAQEGSLPPCEGDSGP